MGRRAAADADRAMRAVASFVNWRRSARTSGRRGRESSVAPICTNCVRWSVGVPPSKPRTWNAPRSADVRWTSSRSFAALRYPLDAASTSRWRGRASSSTRSAWAAAISASAVAVELAKNSGTTLECVSENKKVADLRVPRGVDERREPRDHRRPRRLVRKRGVNAVGHEHAVDLTARSPIAEDRGDGTVSCAPRADRDAACARLREPSRPRRVANALEQRRECVGVGVHPRRRSDERRGSSRRRAR